MRLISCGCRAAGIRWPSRCKWSARDFDPASLLVFARAYPKAELLVTTPDASPPFTRALPRDQDALPDVGETGRADPRAVLSRGSSASDIRKSHPERERCPHRGRDADLANPDWLGWRSRDAEHDGRAENGQAALRDRLQAIASNGRVVFYEERRRKPRHAQVNDDGAPGFDDANRSDGAVRYSERSRVLRSRRDAALTRGAHATGPGSVSTPCAKDERCFRFRGRRGPCQRCDSFRIS